MGQVLFRAAACGFAGLVAWLLTEPFAERFIPKDPSVPPSGSGQMWLILLIGALVGLAAGLMHGLARGSRRHALESSALGFVFGAIGVSVGSQIGVLLSGAVMNVPPGGIAYMEGPNRIVARALALLPIGVCMGAAIGVTLRSKRGLVAGLLGGTVGGLFVGFGFDILADLLGGFSANLQSGVEIPEGYMLEVGGPSRALLAVGLGVAVGLFVAVFDRATRQAWVRLVLGRNEGKEWPVDTDQTMIGRDERAHVPLFGDMNVAPLHAIIFRQGGQYVLQDQGTAIGVGWNGQRVATANLSPGDTFQVGSHNLQFLMKESAARAMQEGRAYGAPVGAPLPQPLNPIQQPYQAPGMQTYVQPGTPAMGGMGSAPSQTMGGMGSPGSTTSGQPQANAAGNTRVLVAVSGPLTGQRFEVSGTVEAGREAMGIPLGFDPQASRRHAAFTLGPGGLQVQDLGSTNGTFVNGARVQSAALNRGDTVTIGNNSFRVE